MKLFHYICITFVIAFVVHYWIISYMVSRVSYNSRGKFYLSTMVASIMCLWEVIIYDSYRDTISLFYYIGLGIIIYGMIYMYNIQSGVDDEDYLKQMLEYQSRDILLADRIIKNTDSQSMKTLASTILNRRKRDIDAMKKIMADKDREIKAPITGKKLFSYAQQNKTY